MIDANSSKPMFVQVAEEIDNLILKDVLAEEAGVKVEDINKLLKQFELMQQLVRQMSGNSKAMKRMKRGGRGGLGGLGNLFGGGGGRPYGF